MSQRADIEGKYEKIYGDLVGMVSRYIQLSKASQEVVYERLKVITQAGWVLLTTHPQPKTPEDANARMAEHLARSVTWSEGNRVVGGNVEEYMRFADAAYANVIAHYARSADLVIDLGCGWGHRMVDIYRKGITAQFYGGDRSEHSRSLTKMTTGLFPDMRAEWFPFDFLRPDLSPISGDYKSVCVFSIHAIEQVEHVGSAVFDALTTKFKNVVGVHIEPIAPQIDPTETALKAYFGLKHYNKDLIEVLDKHPQIDIDRREALFLNSDYVAPSSLGCGNLTGSNARSERYSPRTSAARLERLALRLPLFKASTQERELKG